MGHTFSLAGGSAERRSQHVNNAYMKIIGDADHDVQTGNRACILNLGKEASADAAQRGEFALGEVMLLPQVSDLLPQCNAVQSHDDTTPIIIDVKNGIARIGP